MKPKPTAMAIAAHPDDIEFYMAGTLMLLAEAGFEIHYLNLSSGNCGSAIYPAGKLRKMRRMEARNAARILGATYHPSMTDDLEILYDIPTLRKLAAVVREVQPSVVLTHSPEDYMEDHMNTARLAVTATFARGMPNFRTTPSRKSYSSDAIVYHAMPHGLCDGLRQPVLPDFFVDTTSAHERKCAALEAHTSQRGWLDTSQGMDSYVASMDEMSRTLGRMSGRFKHAEGWRRRLHLGFSVTEIDPLRDALSPVLLARPI